MENLIEISIEYGNPNVKYIPIIHRNQFYEKIMSKNFNKDWIGNKKRFEICNKIRLMSIYSPN